jgi:hypothetical protein
MSRSVIFSRAKRTSGFAAGLLWAAGAIAAPWEFSAPITVAPPAKGVFHHLESAGRRSIAVSSGTVAVVWEDNRDGVPRAYAAFHRPGTNGFMEQRLSGAVDAYEPVVAALPGGQFIFGWEEDGAVWARVGGPGQFGDAQRLSHSEASQITLAAGEAGLFAAWAERAGRFMAIQVVQLSLDHGTVRPAFGAPVAVDGSPKQDQLYPALTVLKTAAVVAWEDRRSGHTVLLYSQTRDGRVFSAPQRLNEQMPRRSQGFGGGTGVARVALARLDTDHAAAVWLDKREFLGGYDVYAAFSDSGAAHFGRNEKVQDEFGNDIGQWHATIAARPGGPPAVAWDDDRDGNPDIWLSWRTTSGWSTDLGVPGASGPGPDTNPAITMDDDGNLYLVWLAQENANGPTQLRYLEGRRIKSPIPPVSAVH